MFIIDDTYFEQTSFIDVNVSVSASIEKRNQTSNADAERVVPTSRRSQNPRSVIFLGTF